MSRPAAGKRRPPAYDGSPKHCRLCGLDKPRDPDNFDVNLSKTGSTADGLMCYCLSCHHLLIAARRRRQIAVEDGKYRLGKLRIDHLRGLAMLNVMIAVDLSAVANADVVRLTNAELARLQALPIAPDPEPKGRRRCTRPSN